MGEAGEMQEPSSLEQALEWLRKRFRPDAARDVHITYQIALEGADPGGLALQISDGVLEPMIGKIEGADVTFTLSEVDFYALLAGRENPDLLFMAERLRVDGELSRALLLRKLFGSLT